MKRIKRRKQVEGTALWVMRCAVIVLSIFHLYTAATHPLTAIHQRSFHFAWIILLVFLLYPHSAKISDAKPRFHDWILAILAFYSGLHIFFRANAIALSGGMYEPYDIWVGIVALVLTFEAARRVVGYQLTGLALIFLIYAYVGRYMPEPFTHAGFSTERIIEHLYLTTEGIFSLVLGVSATYIFMFIMFGSFLQLTGVASLFNDLAMALAGGTRGGPAKIAVISSSLMGTVSGSTSANVATTGSFTIPLMKKIGYPPYFAGAIEAAASAGGQIMPPVMGAASFIMADTLGIPYLDVLKAALIPAILYYLGVFLVVDLRAKKLGLKGLPREALPDLYDLLKRRGYLLLPLGVIIYLLLKGYNPLFCAFWALVSAFAIYLIKSKGKVDLKDIYQSLERGTLSAVPVATACAIVGVIIGVASLTSIAFSLGDIIIQLTRGLLFPTLLLTMLVAIVMGMGLPTTACYIITATIAAPILTKMGIKPLAAHMFVFYFGILSTITPPVAIGAYTASGIAGSDPTKTAWTAVKIALAGFVIPYIFITNSDLLIGSGTETWNLLLALIKGTIAILSLASLSEGILLNPFGVMEKGLLGLTIAVIIYGGNWSLMIGALTFVSAIIINRLRGSKL